MGFRKPTGTATADKVLSGYTFSNDASDGLVGSYVPAGYNVYFHEAYSWGAVNSYYESMGKITKNGYESSNTKLFDHRIVYDSRYGLDVYNIESDEKLYFYTVSCAYSGTPPNVSLTNVSPFFRFTGFTLLTDPSSRTAENTYLWYQGYFFHYVFMKISPR